MNKTALAFLLLFSVHSIVSIFAYRYLTTKKWSDLSTDPKPIEATTEEQRARGERMFYATEHQRLVTFDVPLPIRLYVIYGYVALLLALVIKLFSHIRSLFQ